MDEVEKIAIQHVADALVEILDNPAAGEIAAGVYESSPKVAYAALCYAAEAITREQFLEVVRENA
jgi:hypothetical protein